MSTERLLKLHEDNKNYLSRVNFDKLSSSNSSNIRIVDRYGENLLLEYIIESRRKTQAKIFHKKDNYKYIRVKDSSTGKYVFLSVPNTINRCKIALAWTFDLSPEEYDLIFET